jgi:hypothetical protein
MKLQLRGRVQAVIFAYESGVVTLGHNPAAGGEQRGHGLP